MSKNLNSIAVFVPVCAVPVTAYAATGVTVEALLLILLVVGSVFWIAFAAITPFRAFMRRIPRHANRVGLFLLAMLAFAYATASVILGKTTLGGGVVHEVIEPVWFWNLVKFQLGAGCVLLALSVFAAGRSE